MSSVASNNSLDANSEGIMLSARQLFCERDDRVLFKNLDFDLAEGQVLQVQGSNGSGKTTPVSYTHLTLPTILRV